jgi:hypothetical protein
VVSIHDTEAQQAKQALMVWVWRALRERRCAGLGVHFSIRQLCCFPVKIEVHV